MKEVSHRATATLTILLDPGRSSKRAQSPTPEHITKINGVALMRRKPSCWRLAKLPQAICLLSVMSGPAFGITFKLGEVEGKFDSSLSIGASWSARGADPDLIGASNGGQASSPTNDDGRLNFKKGETFSKIFKGIHDLELRYADTGVFVRGKYWYDFELKDEHRQLYDIDDHNRKEGAQSSGAQILDAFVYHNYTVADLPGAVRLGKQVVSWGESTFLQNGINSINPIDVSAFRRPGAEIKEGLIPVNMFYLSQGLTDSLSAEAFYQLEWDQTVVDNCGTFFTGADVAADGCDKRLAFAGSDLNPDPAAGYRYVGRLGDRDARDSGQYGVLLRWFAEELNATEFALYAMNYHSRTPILSSVVGAAPFDANAATGEASAKYLLEYPEDIRLYGLSFATMVGATSLSGEISHRPNMPMQINTTDLILGAIAPVPALGNPVFSSGHASTAAGDEIRGYVRKPFTQAQVTAVQFIDQVLGADRLTLIGEVGYSHIDDISQNELRFGRDGVYGSGDVLGGACTSQLNTDNPGECNDKGFFTTTSWGYSMRASLEYSDVIAGVNLRPNLSWSHDVDGYGPTFNEGNKAISLGLDGDLLSTYNFSLSYTDFFGGEYNTNVDRDFVALSVGVNF